MKLKVQMTILACIIALASTATSMDKLKRGVFGKLTTAKNEKGEVIREIECKAEDLTDKIPNPDYCPKTINYVGATKDYKFTRSFGITTVIDTKVYSPDVVDLQTLDNWLKRSTKRGIGKTLSDLGKDPMDTDDGYTKFTFVRKEGDNCRYRISRAVTDPDRACITFYNRPEQTTVTTTTKK